MCSHEFPLLSAQALPNQGRPLRGLVSLVGSTLNLQPLGQGVQVMGKPCFSQPSSFRGKAPKERALRDCPEQ